MEPESIAISNLPKNLPSIRDCVSFSFMGPHCFGLRSVRFMICRTSRQAQVFSKQGCDRDARLLKS
jgi:hypothetical protein